MPIEVVFNNNRILNYQKSVNGINGNYTIDITKWRPVNNTIRCFVLYDGKTFKYTYPIKTLRKIKIALIVESPHKDEFNDIFKPIRPMNGSSGKKFDNKICDILNLILGRYNLGKGFYEIKIFNPVRYQASCHHFFNNKIPNQMVVINNNYSLDRDFTNEVWKVMYDNQNGPKEENNFKNEIHRYMPKYIINCCTGELKKGHPLGKSKRRSDLKAIVRNSLYVHSKSNNLKWETIYKEYKHPSRW